MRVVVTGLGCVTPIGNTVADFRESLYAGRTGIAAIDPNIPGWECWAPTPASASRPQRK